MRRWRLRVSMTRGELVSLAEGGSSASESADRLNRLDDLRRVALEKDLVERLLAGDDRDGLQGSCTVEVDVGQAGGELVVGAAELGAGEDGDAFLVEEPRAELA